MKNDPVPPPALCDDEQRLEALRRYQILDTPPEEVFDGIVRLAARVCRAPIAAIILIDEDRQWFKSEVGLGVRQTSLDISICAHTIGRPGLTIVPDTTRDERLARNPLVTSDPHLRFYAGATLETPDGHALGTLCVMDHVPRELDEAQRDALLTLARQVMAQLELRRELAAQARIQEELRRASDAAERANRVLSESEERHRTILESITDAFFALDRAWRFTYVNRQAEALLGRTRDDLLGKSIWEEYAPAVGTEFDHAYRRAMDGGVTVTFEAFYPPHDRHYEVHAYPSTDGLSVYFRDIGERKRAEATIAEQVRLAEFGRDIGLALSEGLTLEEMLGRCAEVTVRHLDGAFARIWTPDESGEMLVLRASAGMYTHTDGPHARIPVGRYKIGQIAQQRQPHLTNAVIGDPRIPAQDWARAEGMVAFAGYPLVVEGRLAGVLAMFARRPLSEATLAAMESVSRAIALGIERKRAAEAVAENEAWLATTLTSIGDAVIATDERGRVRLMNPIAEALTGWRQAEAAGRPMEEVFHIINEYSRRPAEHPVERVIREGVVVGLANHTVLISREGGETPIEDSAAPIRGEGGRLAGVVMVFRDVTHERAAQAHLRASEARKAAILDTALDAIVTIDHEGRVVEWNPAAERTFGHGRAEVLGREMAGLIVPPALREAHRRGMARYLATGEGPVLGRRIEVTAIRADGSEFPVELAIARISADGPPLFTAHIRDITESKAIERRRAARLAVTEVLAGAGTPGEAAPAILRALCEALGWDLGALWLLDEEAGVLRCLDLWSGPSAAFGPFVADSRGRSYPQGAGLPGRVWATGRPAWIPDVTVEPNFPHGPIAAEAGLHGAFAAPITSGDRLLGVVEFFSGRVQEPDPDLLEMIATLGGQLGQFLERRRAEERLRYQHELTGAITDNATTAIFLMDDRSRCVFMNPAAEAMTGYAFAEAEGRVLHDLIHHTRPDGSPYPVSECPIDRALPERSEVRDHEDLFVRKDGTFFPVLCNARPVQGVGGRAVTVIEVRDITERKRYEDELRHAKEEAEAANQAKTQFLAVLSHELRTPLNPILLAASSMLERPADPQELRPTLEMIRQNVLLQARLIDDLLDVMRIVRGKLPLHWEVADGHTLIDQAVQVCRSEVLGHRLRLVVEATARHRHVNADPARLQQVFWNLIRNAVKFTPEGGTVTVRTRNEPEPGQAGSLLVVEVSDTGIGIESDVLPRIFDPFQQGETTITRKFGGLGLGLAICKGIVDAHGGTLEAESGGKGRGATFRVVLKAMPEPEAEGEGQPVGGPEPSGTALPSSLRILLVEDEPATLRIMARLLRGLGHEVTAAGSVAEAIRVYEGGDFDLIISDIGLPDGSGLELMRQVVSRRGPVAAIALTGYGMEEDIRRSREAGFTAHLTKPIDFAKLEAMILQVALTRP